MEQVFCLTLSANHGKLRSHSGTIDFSLLWFSPEAVIIQGVFVQNRRVYKNPERFICSRVSEILCLFCVPDCAAIFGKLSRLLLLAFISIEDFLNGYVNYQWIVYLRLHKILDIAGNIYKDTQHIWSVQNYWTFLLNELL